MNSIPTMLRIVNDSSNRCLKSASLFKWYEYNNHLLIYYSVDEMLHISIDELNALDGICLSAEMYDSVKMDLIGFNASYNWNLRYDFDYVEKKCDVLQYSVVDFDFSNKEHYIKAATLINNGSEWLNEKNIEKMTKYAAFDPSLWFFLADRQNQELVALSISAFDKSVRQTDLDWIYVRSDYQGKGVGRELILETIRRCKDKSDDICVGGTVEFYRKCGFYNYELWTWAVKDGYQFSASGIQP